MKDIKKRNIGARICLVGICTAAIVGIMIVLSICDVVDASDNKSSIATKDFIDYVDTLESTVASEITTVEETTVVETTVVETTVVETTKATEPISTEEVTKEVKEEVKEKPVEVEEVETKDNTINKAEDSEEENNVSSWNGQKLSPFLGRVQGPSGEETYYNLPMQGVVDIMRSMGYSKKEYPYHVRQEDGCKMLGDYIMVAADLNIRPRGTILECSLGTAIVCDTGSFTYSNPYQLDVATAW